MQSKAFILCVVACISLGVCWQLYTKKVFAENMPPSVSVDPKMVMSSIMPLRGAGMPKYVLVEFGDYQCPPCAQNAPKVVDLLNKNKDSLAFVFRNFPLEKHPLAKKAASIAMACRYDYWKVHDQLYSYDSKITTDLLDKISKEHKLAKQDLDAAALNVTLDQSVAKEFKVNATPSFYVLATVGQKAQVYGPASLDQIQWMIDQNAG